ncbi:MAG: LysR family transcriptional regulator [Hyphomicrobiales bacterium]
MRTSEYELYRNIVEEGSLSGAGRKLNISNAMVSKRLAELERRLGTQLILRTTHRFSLTPSGQSFYEDVKKILETVHLAEGKISGVQHIPAGRLRVSAPTSFGRLHIAPLLHGFMQAHPQIDLEFNLTDKYVDIRNEGIDLAIRIAVNLTASVDGVRLGTNYRILCASPEYLKLHGEPKDISQLNEHKLLATNDQMPWRLTGSKGEVLIAGKSLVSTNSSEIVRELAITGSGIALRSLWDISDELDTGRLVRILPQYEGSNNVGIYAAWPQAEIIPAAVKIFAAYMKEALKPSLARLP